MRSSKTYISRGDIIDLYYKLRNKGSASFLSRIFSSGEKRTLARWDSVQVESDYWIIPAIRERWNKLSTGDPAVGYEEYLISKYLSGKETLSLLSVGCGTGALERKFAIHPEFTLIDGIDIAGKLIEEAKRLAKESGLEKIQYRKADFRHYNSENESYDLILFNSSLHHFRDIHKLTEEKILPLLKEGGLLVIFEYTGPDRLQWTGKQLNFANKMLRRLPPRYRLRKRGKSLKKQVYRPGLLRMILSDPSEAVDSSSILPALHKHLIIIEEKKLGGDLLHLLFKDIAHNFLDSNLETEALLKYFFKKEDDFLKLNKTSDLTFGIYQKK